MIFLAPECFPCLLRQADLAARAQGASEGERVALAAKACAMLQDLPLRDEVPAETATRLQDFLREALGTDDPFGPVKERHLARFEEMARWAETQVERSPDPWAAAVWLAGFGNIMDSGIIEQETMDREMASAAQGIHGFRLPTRFRERLLAAERVGVLLDNAGEVAFDLPLLGLLASRGKPFWIGVKGGPVIDDVTLDDAHRLGLAVFGELVSNGNRGVGTVLPLCPEPFRRRLASSDLVLSKGQGNFETLVGKLSNAYFLLRCKCAVVSRAVGRPEGELLLLESDGGHAA
ncbi:MAG: damage-control phosphatase ARMT1 family protein [Verrucomicrobiota bacterium]